MILRHNIRPNILYSHQARIMKVQAPPSGTQGPTGPSLGQEGPPIPALGVRPGQVSVWRSQSGPRIRYYNFRAVGPSYLKNCFSTTFWTIRSCRLHFWGALSKWHSIWENFFSLRARTPNLGYVVLGAPGNVCKHLSIPGYLEKAGKGAWPPTVQ